MKLFFELFLVLLAYLTLTLDTTDQMCLSVKVNSWEDAMQCKECTYINIFCLYI